MKYKSCKCFIFFLFCFFLCLPDIYSQEHNKQKDILNVSLLWDPQDYPQWYAVQYINELKNRFGPALSLNIFYASDNEEAERQLLILTKGQSALFSYTQGRILIPSIHWEDSVNFTEVSPQKITEELETGKGKLLFQGQQIPEKLIKTYNEKKYPLLMVEDKIYQDIPSLIGWIYFINGFLPDNKKIGLFQDQNPEKEHEEKTPLIVIEDENHISGKLDEEAGLILDKFGIKSEIKRVSSQEEPGKRYINQLNIEKLPFYIFDKKIEKDPAFKKLKDLNIITIYEGEYIFNPGQGDKFYLKRERIPFNLKLFVMAQCPFAIQAENAIYQAIDNKSIPKEITVDIHYIVSETINTEMPFLSLHGAAEWEEAVRQKLIQKYFPGKFSKYLLERNKNPDSSLWDISAERAGIDPKYIRDKFEEGKKYLKDDVQIARELDITGSPTFLWENRELLKSVKALKKILYFQNLDIEIKGSCGD